MLAHQVHGIGSLQQISCITSIYRYAGVCLLIIFLRQAFLQAVLHPLRSCEACDLAPQAAGLWAISAGLSRNYKDDLEQLEEGMKIYDALYSWIQFAQSEVHTWAIKL